MGNSAMKNFETEKHFGSREKIFYPQINITSGVIRVVLTTRCCYACPYCFREGEKFTDDRALTPDFLKKVISNGKERHGIHTVKFTGGEPLIYPQLEVVLKDMNEIGIKNIDFTTNGYFLEENIDLLLEHKVEYLTVTLNTLDPYLYERMHNAPKGALERVLKGIKKASDSGLKIRINLTAYDIKGQEVYDVIDYCKRNNLVMRICEPYYVKGSSETKDKESYRKIVGDILDNSTEVLESACQTVRYVTTQDGATLTIMKNLCDNRFCDSCGKYLYVRLTSDKKLKPCLSRTDTEVTIPDNPTEEELDLCFSKAALSMGEGIEAGLKGLDV
jgi:cyclic pyranopterin phosphate synthase